MFAPWMQKPYVRFGIIKVEGEKVFGVMISAG